MHPSSSYADYFADVDLYEVFYLMYFRLCRVAKLNGNIPSSEMRIEAKSVKFSEGSQDAPQNATSSKPYSQNKEKHVLLSPLLKRKTLEVVSICIVLVSGYMIL